MTTCREIVTGGLQLLGAYGGNETPSAEDMETGFTALQSMFDMWVASGMFGRLTDVYKTSDYTAKEGERVTAPAGPTLSTPATITGLCTGTRAPRDLACIEFNQTTRRTYVYDRVAWVQINALTLNSVCPFADRGSRGLMACVAVAVADDFGLPVKASVGRLASQFRGLLSLKLGSTQDPSAVDYF